MATIVNAFIWMQFDFLISCRVLVSNYSDLTFFIWSFGNYAGDTTWEFLISFVLEGFNSWFLVNYSLPHEFNATTQRRHEAEACHYDTSPGIHLKLKQVSGNVTNRIPNTNNESESSKEHMTFVFVLKFSVRKKAGYSLKKSTKILEKSNYPIIQLSLFLEFICGISHVPSNRSFQRCLSIAVWFTHFRLHFTPTWRRRRRRWISWCLSKVKL